MARGLGCSALIVVVAGLFLTGCIGPAAQTDVPDNLEPVASNPPTATTTLTPEAPRPTATLFWAGQRTEDWEALRRPLDFPPVLAGEQCPVTKANSPDVVPAISNPTGNGPFYFSSQSFAGAYQLLLAEDGWTRYKRLIVVTPDYEGPLLVRGWQLDGDAPLRFLSYGSEYMAGSSDEFPGFAELRIPPGRIGSISNMPGARHLGGYTMLREPGCYIYQIDGEDFTEHIVFEFLEQSPGEAHPPLMRPALPGDWRFTSAAPVVGSGTRVGLEGNGFKAVLIASPSHHTDVVVPDPSWNTTATVAGLLVWQSNAEGLPTSAVWNDGDYRYQLELVWHDANDVHWSLDTLVHLVVSLGRSEGK